MSFKVSYVAVLFLLTLTFCLSQQWRENPDSEQKTKKSDAFLKTSHSEDNHPEVEVTAIKSNRKKPTTTTERQKMTNLNRETPSNRKKVVINKSVGRAKGMEKPKKSNHYYTKKQSRFKRIASPSQRAKLGGGASFGHIEKAYQDLVDALANAFNITNASFPPEFDWLKDLNNDSVSADNETLDWLKNMDDYLNFGTDEPNWLKSQKGFSNFTK